MTLFWDVWAVINIHGVNPRPYNTVFVINKYLHNLFGFISTIFNTFLDLGTLEFYRISFLGVLGWLDSPFTPFEYNYISILLISLIVLYVITYKGEKKKFNFDHFIFGGLILASLLAIWPILLLAVTDYPSSKVEGLQGRYLIPPILFFLVVFLNSRKNNNFYVLLGLAIFFLSSTILTEKNIINRYYITNASSIGRSVINDTCCNIFGDLVAGRKFSQTFENKGNIFHLIEFRFANYNHASKGSVFLTIQNEKDEKICSKSVPVSVIRDGEWILFDVNCPPAIDKQYKLVVETDNIVPGLTLWASKTNSYLGGQAIVDGKEQDADFAFKVIYAK
jgi:hypothetical protein